jgi:flavin prenyltransferase
MSDEEGLIVGITGATGMVYGVRLLEQLRALGVTSHLIVSRAGEMSRALETNLSSQELHRFADHYYPITDVGAAPASGSFLTLGMIVALCSIRTLSEIVSGVTSTLLTRAADVLSKRAPTIGAIGP